MLEKWKTKTIGIFGMKGTGKTYLTREMIESTARDCVIFDTIGAIFPRNAKKFSAAPVDLETQAEIWHAMINSKKHINISVDLSQLVRAEIVEFTDISLKNMTVRNKYFFFDEIAEYIPQHGDYSYELERLVRHGRNQGHTFVFNTQRPALVSKNILNVVDVLIVFRLVWNRDIEVIKNLMATSGMSTAEIKEKLKKISNQKAGENEVFEFSGTNMGD